MTKAELVATVSFPLKSAIQRKTEVTNVVDNVAVNVPVSGNDAKNVVENSTDVVENVVEKLNKRQQAIFDLIKTTPTISAALLATTIGTASRTIQRDLKYMQELGLITHEGPDKGGKWICQFKER